MAAKIKYSLFLFALGSVTGWGMEVLYRSVECQKLVTSGFLSGPYCPIYGIGTVFIYFVCKREHKLTSFLKIVLLCSLLEYVISWMAENWFHRILWDYSSLPFSLGTRVNLFFSVSWGLLGMWFLFYIEPWLSDWFDQRVDCAVGIGMSVTFLIGIDWLMNVL